MRKPIVVMCPVEFGCHSWGPFQWEHRRVYYPDGSDWTGQWSVGIAHVGQLAVIPPAWLLNLFVEWGWIEMRVIESERVTELRAESEMTAKDKPWLTGQTR